MAFCLFRWEFIEKRGERINFANKYEQIKRKLKMLWISIKKIPTKISQNDNKTFLWYCKTWFMNFVVHLFLFHSLFLVIFKLDFLTKLFKTQLFIRLLALPLSSAFAEKQELFFCVFVFVFSRKKEKTRNNKKLRKLLLEIDLCGHHKSLKPPFNFKALS